jgi:chaperone required for assembly of F1-ATPase
MRDFLEFDHDAAALERAAADPIAKARALNRRELPKRFYKVATVRASADGFAVELDGRTIRTPAKRLLILPSEQLAGTIAAEWNGQGDVIDPGTMSLTRLANSVIDGVADRRAEVIDDLAAYAGSDLLCYRAEAPERLVERQTLVWDPILDWVEERFGARFLVSEGIMHLTQDSDAIDRIRASVARHDAFTLAGLHSVTTLTGSVLIALALVEGRLDPDAAWAAGSLDDLWSLEVWGHDEEAAHRMLQRRRDFDAAVMALGKAWLAASDRPSAHFLPMRLDRLR